ncbi:chaperone regulator [Apiospora aurea]|uniref:Chaperone regulator n=1 Tax=Apiospora aurea TaxID=335848 RepID=A0ABR1QVJ2_9PEZI
MEDPAGDSNGSAGLTAKSLKQTWDAAVSTLLEEDRSIKRQVELAMSSSREQDRLKYFEERKALKLDKIAETSLEELEESLPELLERIRQSVDIDRNFVNNVVEYMREEAERRDGERRPALEQYELSDDDAGASSRNDPASEGPSSNNETRRPRRRKPRRSSRWLMYICSRSFFYDVIFWIAVLLVLATMFHQIFQHPPPFFGDGPPGWFNAKKPHQGPPNYYAILDIAPNATDREIRVAYRREIRIHHPDKSHTAASSAANPGNSGDTGDDKEERQAAANERMRLITAAYETLANGSKRCLYNYREWPKSEGGVQHTDGAQSLREYYQCVRKARYTLFRKEPGNGDGAVEKAKTVEKARAGMDREKMAREEEIEKARERMDRKEKAKKEVVKEKKEQRKSESAAVEQQTTIESPKVPVWKQCLVYAEQAGEAYHQLCYENPLARTGLFALTGAIAWRFGVELPDLCLGGG